MVAIVTAAIGWLGSATAKTLLDRVLFFLALKAFLIALFVIVVPIVLNNVLHGMVEEAMMYVGSKAINGEWGGVAQFTGIMGWLVDCFQIPACFSVLVSALQLHYVLKLIPFSPVK